jgi:hypothetical protein
MSESDGSSLAGIMNHKNRQFKSHDGFLVDGARSDAIRCFREVGSISVFNEESVS